MLLEETFFWYDCLSGHLHIVERQMFIMSQIRLQIHYRLVLKTPLVNEANLISSPLCKFQSV